MQKVLQSLHHRELLSHTENAAAALPEMLLELMCITMYQALYKYICIYLLLNIYIHFSQSADVQLLLL